jgi:hypothetical protein
VGNLSGKGRFCQEAVEKILESTLENVAMFREMGGLIAPGTDAGAWAVPHGSDTEIPLLAQAGVRSADLQKGIHAIEKRF